MLDFLSAHLDLMAQARASGDLRTVHGWQYPVPEGALMVWQAEQARIRSEKVRRFLESKTGSRAAAEKAFA